jgi:hypothetical protein
MIKKAGPMKYTINLILKNNQAQKFILKQDNILYSVLQFF